eukprot:gene50959-68212_t
MQQAQQMQQKMQDLQVALERLEIVGSSGAGLVKVTVNGKNETRRIEIDASLFKPEDKGVVEDLIVAAANDARGKVEETVQAQMRDITGGLPLTSPMNGPEIERLIQLLGRLPGLGPRSARRVALHLLKKRETLMQPLGAALADAARAIRACGVCGNLDTIDPCSICADPRRDAGGGAFRARADGGEPGANAVGALADLARDRTRARRFRARPGARCSSHASQRASTPT